MIDLYNAETNQLLGSITEADLQVLIDALEEESSEDQDYYIDKATIEFMLMVFSLGVMGVLTPYATGPAPVYFGSGYIPRRDFWRLGLIFGLIFLASLLVIGGVTLPRI